MHDAHMPSDTTTITTLLTLPPDLVERDRVRRQALRAGAVQHPGLAPLRSVAFTAEGLALTWEIDTGSEPVTAPVDPLTVLSPIAAGLALLHDAGLAHGGVTADAVYVVAGRGMLTGWRPGGQPADDVADLVGLLDSWLPTGSVGADIVQLLIAGADPDPVARPSMARLAAALDRAAAYPSPPVSPPAQRRARLDDAPPPRPVEHVAATVPPHRAIAPAKTRGRHAARRSPAGSVTSARPWVRLPWRWGVALGGATVVAFLGLSALGSSGTAQEICPAPASAQAGSDAGASR